MTDFSVHQYGVDSSGRPIFMTAYMHEWFESVVDDLGWRPVIVQGAFMERVPGGGASASAGYHDKAGCIDCRVRDLTPTKREDMIRAFRRHGAAAWVRDQVHGGMDEHCHLVLGTDSPLAPGAASQWSDYRNGYDGLYPRGVDYEWRPKPLVLTPPEDALNADDKKWISDLLDAKLAKFADSLLDDEKVDKAKTVSVRQGINQARNK